MKTSLRALLILLLGLLVSVRCSQAQAPEISAGQARQILSGYLQAPDTTLTAATVSDVNSDGHTDYIFYGDAGGSYGIDAAIQGKLINFAGISGGGATPANPPFTAVQLQQTAATYVASHFPNYQPGLLTQNADPIDVQWDADEYYIQYYALAPSGAEQPIQCLVIVEEDSGKLKSYDETSIPVTISTSPAVSQSQAVQAGRDWIYQNVSTDPAAGQFQTDNGVCRRYGSLCKWTLC